MNNNRKRLNDHLLDAMIEISDNNAAESIKILEASGIDTEKAISRSLNKVEALKTALAARTTSNSDSVVKRISELLKSAPMQTTNFLKDYLNINAPTLQYQSRSLFTASMLQKMEGKIDFNDLEKKLSEQKIDTNGNDQKK
ncbi:hypothetical protein DU508_21795 [Pedobacter chinensis]|uniref:Uncharacterized protein n=1 Tax=Pedobacter chinensis TaxID=2282421 RepID=A0A369PW71_9SPHI|nr:hypothetical protein [Pedobacter chinensis]RDC54358.1 hypothetical protein DU508_21795 [Pedobacter chinensis]